MNVTALDFDGVMAHIHEAITPRMNARYELDVKVEDIKDWDFWKVHKLNSAFFREIASLRSEHPSSLPAYDGATSFVYWLQERSEALYVLTANPPEQLNYIRNWMQHHGFPRLPVFTSWGKDKTDFDWDVLIDDSPDYAARVLRDRRVITPARPWNKSGLHTWDQVQAEFMQS